MSHKRVLNIIERGYRATLEEQDDPVVWLNTVLRDQGVDVHEEDLAARGIDRSELIAEVRPIARAALPELLAAHALVWAW